MTRAYQLSAGLPAREYLTIAARYQQLVFDRPDSALEYWKELARFHPEDPLAYEGRLWAYRALGLHQEMAAAADTALQLDSSAAWPNVAHMLAGSAGDTVKLLATARQLRSRFPDGERQALSEVMLRRGDLAGVLTRFDSTFPPGTTTKDDWVAPRRQPLLLGLGRIREARAELETILAGNLAQGAPRALIAQGWAELADGGAPAASAALAARAVDWVAAADLSPPAVARLLERAADVTGRARDTLLLQRIRGLLLARDRGRKLRSYRLALVAVDACDAYARGDFATAATRAREARSAAFFGRSMWTWVMLEADARRLAGEHRQADSLYRTVVDGLVSRDSDTEVWIVMRRMAVAALAER